MRENGLTDPAVRVLGPDEMPVPNGIHAESGQLLPHLTPADLQYIKDDPELVHQRGLSEEISFLVDAETDSNELSQTGWGVIFPKEINPVIREALQPLLELREKQAGRLFRIFEGNSGYQSGDTARAWLERQGVTLAVVNPQLGVPFYLLLVGSPQQLPLEFQYVLDTYWGVGRLYFENVDEYRKYSEAVVAYETEASVPQAKCATIFATQNDADRATGLLSNQLVRPLVNGTDALRPLGVRQNFRLHRYLGDDATKENLLNILTGSTPEGAPALLFTGSHGAYFPASDSKQNSRIGALVCQDWPGFGRAQSSHYFAAEDLSADARVHGMVHFLFACYGGGCPKFDSYSHNPDGTPLEIVPEAMFSRLPQVLLSHGTLAVVAHVDRAFAYSFQTSRGRPQINEFRDVMTRVLMGGRIGYATDTFNLRWTVLSAELAEAMREPRSGITDAQLANQWVARDDARNYVILGDPAVRLRTEVMTAVL